MILRADHVAGAAFVVMGVGVIALSGNLPTGSLSMPGSGFLPKIIATLSIVFGIALAWRAAAESPPFAEISWADGKHAIFVTAVAAAAIALYTTLGFIVAMVLMLLTLLIVAERRNPVRAGIYSLAIAVATFLVFEYLLKTPLPGWTLGS
jgi:hypothetical protein